MSYIDKFKLFLKVQQINSVQYKLKVQKKDMHQVDPQNSFSFSIDVQNDIFPPIEQLCNDMSFSISSISSNTQDPLKNQIQPKQLQKCNQCPQKHPMRYQLIDSTRKAIFLYCNVCDNKVDNQSNVFWRCQRCDYDLCSKCGGCKKTICPFGHQIHFVFQYSHKRYECDICLKAITKSGWHCECDFDICENCFNFH